MTENTRTDQRIGKNDRRRQPDRKRLILISTLAFLAGMIVATAAILGYIKGVRSETVLSAQQLRYYQSLDRKFGKYYEMQEQISRHSIYDVDDTANAAKRDAAWSRSIVKAIPDRYAAYYTPSEYENLQRKYTDAYTGIGISVVRAKGGGLVIRRVLRDSPAESSGIRSGDRLLTVEGKKPSSVSDASRRILGKPGTTVKLTLNRGGEEIRVKLLRAKVEERSVEFRKVRGRMGVIQITSFRRGTTDELKDAIHSLSDDGITKVVIDLRGNSGGVMKEGVRSADLLLPACKIITAKDHSGREKVYNSDASAEPIDYAVLVDGRTASAAEILAGAIQKNHGGKIIGQTTYGKGLIQSVYKLRDGSAIRLTTEEYYLPGGTAINGRGITPDISVSGADALTEALRSLS